MRMEVRARFEVGAILETDITSEDDGNQNANLKELNEREDNNRSFQLFFTPNPLSSTVLLLVTSQLGLGPSKPSSFRRTIWEGMIRRDNQK